MSDAQHITRALGGRWHGRYGAAACPICQRDGRKGQNALTLTDGTAGLLAHCKKAGCAFGDIVDALRRKGLVAGRSRYALPSAADLARINAAEDEQAAKREAIARRLWQQTSPIRGTIAETYLRRRGISCDLPATLRFHPACWHPTAKHFPAMVALIEGAPRLAVHRTYLRPDGTGKAAEEPAKAMLGACAGGAVRLVQAAGPLVVAEGIETALSLACGLLCGPATIWAALSTSGMRALLLPRQPGRLIVAADGDAPGHAAAHALATRADATGWDVSLLPAPDGRDWNDALNMKEVAP